MFVERQARRDLRPGPGLVLLDPDPAVVRAGVEEAGLERGLRERGECREIDRVGEAALLFRIVVRQVVADLFPGLAAVLRTENVLETVIDDVGIVRRKDGGGQPLAAIERCSFRRPGIDLLAFPGAVIDGLSRHRAL